MHPSIQTIHIHTYVVYIAHQKQAEELILGHYGLIQLVIQRRRLVVKDVLETAGPNNETLKDLLQEALGMDSITARHYFFFLSWFKA